MRSADRDRVRDEAVGRTRGAGMEIILVLYKE